MGLVISWVSAAVAVFVTASFLSGFHVRNGFKGALLVAAVLGLLNALFGQLLFHVIGLGTLGLGYLMRPITRWLVMTVMLVVTDKVSKTLKIDGFGIAVIGAIAITVVSEVVGRVLHAIL